MTDPDEPHQRHWLDRYLPAIQLALEEFLLRGEWPERAPFRRRLAQLGHDEIDVDDMTRELPRFAWEPEARQTWPPSSDRIQLGLQVLRELPAAKPLLDTCIAIVRWCYLQYKAEGPLPTIERPDGHLEGNGGRDESLLATAGGDKVVLSRALDVLASHRPSVLEDRVWVGGRVESWMVNLRTIPNFKSVTTVDDYIAAQERNTPTGRKRWSTWPTSDAQSWYADDLPTVQGQSGPVEIFVVMPFSEPWSAGIYDFIMRSADELGAPQGALRVYRADEIAAPGTITDQIKRAIETAAVVIADITSLNANVMWELGYADGCRKSLVILNQDHAVSPFDLYTRRQVLYSSTPTKDDHIRLSRHLVEALRAALGDSQPSWLPG